MNKYIFYYFFVSLTLYCLLPSCKSKMHHYTSPNGDMELGIGLLNNTPVYSLIYLSDTIILNSELGLQLSAGKINFQRIINLEESDFDAIWNPVWGKYKSVRNNFLELNIKYDCLLDSVGMETVIQFRLYDDGLAIRYILPEQQNSNLNFSIGEDLTHFNFKDDNTFWAVNRELPNIGPLKISQFGTLENTELQTPTVFITPDKKYIAIHEADISKFAHIHLVKGSGKYSLRASVLPSDGIMPDTSSWRVIMTGQTPGDLLESNILENLNPPCRIDDPSWIVPGKSMWDWRVWKYVTDDGYEYGLNTDSHKRFIDFASENNIQYLLIDADWYGPEFDENSDPVSSREGVNIEECMAYAKEKKVGIILYLNDIGAKRFGLERVLKQFSEWGASGVKYGFMTGKGQEKVKHTRKVIELCAKYKLLVDFHDGPIPPNGDFRTFPNAITREYCHAQADAKRSYWPETAVSSVFINMIAGPLDLTNGWYGFEGAEKRERVFEFIPGTVAGETAKTLVFFSGLTVLPDAPEEYLKKDDIFEFIRELPGKYDDFKVLQGEIGESVVIARKSGREWFIGGLTNRDERRLSLLFDFLYENINYQMTIYSDTESSHFIDNREAYRVEKTRIVKNDSLNIRMAPGGGFALWIRPE